MHLPEETLRQLLVDAQVVASDAFESAMVSAREMGVPPEQVLREKELVSDEKLGELVARSLNLPFVHLGKSAIPEVVLNLLPEDVAKTKQIVVFERTEKVLKVAAADPNNAQITVELLAQKTQLPVEKYYATDLDIAAALTYYRTNFQEVFEKLTSQEDKVVTTIAHDPPVRKMVEMIVESARKEGASDVHIEPREKEFVIRYRIDGLLRDIATLPKSLHDRVVTRIKVLSNLRTDQHYAAQDGKFRLAKGDTKVDLRVSIIPVADGEKVVLRLLTSQAKAYTLAELGMAEADLKKLQTAAKMNFGMVLVTGPTGSGKTTTIYSVLNTINRQEHNLTSIEDPIEYRIAGANQVQVNEKTGLTFANGLRSLLRQDPDYIFVGEIRDTETASIAVNAALTGHLVFSTLHTNTAAASLPRLYDMKIEPFLVATTVQLIIAQRLVRRVCDVCRVSELITVEQLAKYLDKDTIAKYYIPTGEKQEVRVYKGAGCRVCHNSGYKGRIGIYEVLKITPAIREMVSAHADADAIHAQALAEGMTTMYEDGVSKVSKGLTTIEEVLRITSTEGGEGASAESTDKPDVPPVAVPPTTPLPPQAQVLPAQSQELAQG